MPDELQARADAIYEAERATLSDVVDAWTEVTIVHALSREALTAPTRSEREHALNALRKIGHEDMADALEPQMEIA